MQLVGKGEGQQGSWMWLCNITTLLRSPAPACRSKRRNQPKPSRQKRRSKHQVTSTFMSSSGSSTGRPFGNRRSTSCSVLAHRSRASC